MSSNVLSSAESSPPILSVLPKPQARFVKVKDGRGREIDGLWQRNSRYYYQTRVKGKKNCQRVPLVDEQDEPVKNITEAKDAIERLRRNKKEGEVPQSRRTPVFDEYYKHYLSDNEEKNAKKPSTLVNEKSVLKRWAKYFGNARLNQITRADVDRFVLQRKQSAAAKGEPLSNRTVNYDVLVLGNLLRFAKKEKWLSGKLVTEGAEKLPYKPAKQILFSKEDIDKFCAVALSKKEDGTDRFKNGQMLVDAVRLMAASGARVQSAFALRWSDIDWERRQIHFTRCTKYSKHIIVDFNPELESVLKELRARRQPDTEAIFPATRADGSASMGSLRKSFQLVREAAGLPGFKFHSLRHYFISWCVMAGIDLLTIKEWAGHSDTLLISRVYGHLNAKHRQEAAKKLAFPSRSEAELKPNGVVDVNSLSSAQLLELLQQKLKAENGQAKSA
jgi:integrase